MPSVRRRAWRIGDDPLAFVISANLRRRHLSESQRAMVAAKLATLKRGDNQHSPIGETSQATAAELLNVGKRSVERARKVIDHGTFAVRSIRGSPRGRPAPVYEICDGSYAEDGVF
jgi:hypothetical protein